MSELRRGTALESRVGSFQAGTATRSTRWQPSPEHTVKGAQFASLTYLGKLYYADRIAEGETHDIAYADAHYSYGAKR